MPNRDEVLKNLERISEWLFQQYRVVYDGDAPNYYDAYKTVDYAIALLKEQEAVVRCKDCKYHFVDGDNVRFNMCLLNHNKVQSDDWFCADGERL